MQIAPAAPAPLLDEQQLVEELLPASAHVLELGCGKAEKTRLLARNAKVERIVALEVDEVQHGKNLREGSPDNVIFALGGAEDIPADSETFDLVLMFKSLHHVPVPKLDQALDEIRRVLKPGGLVYLSEPIFAGDYNDILRLFHDEQAVRAAAFDAIRRAVDESRMELVKQIFFRTKIRFRDFAQFERGVLQVTHTQHSLAPECHAEVRARFERHMTPDGAEFLIPMRVDLLRKPCLSNA